MLLGSFASEKILTTRGGRGRMEYSDFPSKISCLTGREFFVGEFSVPETLGYPKGL